MNHFAKVSHHARWRNAAHFTPNVTKYKKTMVLIGQELQAWINAKFITSHLGTKTTLPYIYIFGRCCCAVFSKHAHIKTKKFQSGGTRDAVRLADVWWLTSTGWCWAGGRVGWRRGRVGWGRVERGGVGGREAVDVYHGSFAHVHCCWQSSTGTMNKHTFITK